MLREPREFDFGGLLLAALPAIATGEDGDRPTFVTGMSAKADGALCWRSGAAPLRIRTRAPTAEPGVLPWKAGKSGTFGLGLPTLATKTEIEGQQVRT